MEEIGTEVTWENSIAYGHVCAHREWYGHWILSLVNTDPVFLFYSEIATIQVFFLRFQSTNMGKSQCKERIIATYVVPLILAS